MSYFELKNGMKLYYEDTGEGSPVIMMHGWTSSHDIYTEPAKKLSEKARCIIYDHRGHGMSRQAGGENVTMETLAGDLNEIIGGLGLENVTLVGWSMGAGVAMTYIRDYGCSALKQVVLCDMSPKQLNDSEWKLGLNNGSYTREDMERDERNNVAFIDLYRSFVANALPKTKRVPWFLLRPRLQEILDKCDESVLRSLARSMKIQDNRDVIQNKLTVPLTYFYAVPGSLFSPMLEKWYKENVKVPFKAGAFRNSTHMIISEHPDEFARKLSMLL